jgi:phosphocarrier protein HPr
MQLKTFTIIDKEGMHARPASMLTKAVIKYPGRAEIIFKGKKVSLKSIIGIMGLGIKHGETFDLEVEGEGEVELLAEIVKIMTDNNLISK